MSVLKKLREKLVNGTETESHWIYPENADEFTQVLESSENPVLLYKHSNRCATCLMTKRTAEDLMQVYAGRILFVFVDVIQNRNLSSEIARMASVRHESPQIILFREGEPVFTISHGKIRYNFLKEHIENEIDS